MSKIEDGGPAFPVPEYDGMSLRDWFAGQALQGFLSNPEGGDGSFWSALAADCYDAADAMLAARKTGGE